MTIFGTSWALGMSLLLPPINPILWGCSKYYVWEWLLSGNVRKLSWGPRWLYIKWGTFWEPSSARKCLSRGPVGPLHIFFLLTSTLFYLHCDRLEEGRFLALYRRCCIFFRFLQTKQVRMSPWLLTGRSLLCFDQLSYIFCHFSIFLFFLPPPLLIEEDGRGGISPTSMYNSSCGRTTGSSGYCCCSSSCCCGWRSVFVPVDAAALAAAAAEPVVAVAAAHGILVPVSAAAILLTASAAPVLAAPVASLVVLPCSSAIRHFYVVHLDRE